MCIGVSQAFTCRCEIVDMSFCYKFVRMCTQLSACSIICMCFWVRKCAYVGCNPSRSGTTQQLVQRPVYIITACPAATDRQTRLRALSYKTQTSHPIAETPVAQPSTVTGKWTNTCLQTDKLPSVWGSFFVFFFPEKMKDGGKFKSSSKAERFHVFLFFHRLWGNWPSGMFVLNLYQILLPISQ